MRTRADGRYDFRYRLTGRPDAVYFVSAQYAGIAYFGPLLRTPHVRGDDAIITVFDTTSATIPLRVSGRHVIVGAPAANGVRELIDVYELSNDSVRTLISPDASHPTWTAPLPPAARDVSPAAGDVPADAMRVHNGRVALVTPFPPGLKQVGFRYTLPASSFPLSVPLLDGAEVFELLLEDPETSADGTRLADLGTANVGGHTFRRYLAHDLRRNTVVRIMVRATRSGRAPLYLAAAALALGTSILVGLARAYQPRTRNTPVPALDYENRPGGSQPLARAIAELDYRFQRLSHPPAPTRAEYDARRAELKRRLAAALEAERRRS
jgi:hypothetical protein